MGPVRVKQMFNTGLQPQLWADFLMVQFLILFLFKLFMLFCVDVYVWLHLSWCVCTTLYAWRPEVRITSLFPPVFGLQCSTSGLQVCVANAFSR